VIPNTILFVISTDFTILFVISTDFTILFVISTDLYCILQSTYCFPHFF
jgi:hypothetical protein